MSDDLTPEQVAQIGTTGCATAWADHLWREIRAALAFSSAGEGFDRDDLRDWLAPLLNALNADHAERLTLARMAGELLADDGLHAGPADAPQIILHHPV